MQSPKQLTKLLLSLTLLLTVSACNSQVKIQPAFPPVADVNALQEKKPVPTPDILTSSKASSEYNAALEAWGDRLSAAGHRLCIWLKDRKMDVSCESDR